MIKLELVVGVDPSGEGVSVVVHEGVNGDKRTQPRVGLRFVITIKASGLLRARPSRWECLLILGALGVVGSSQRR